MSKLPPLRFEPLFKQYLWGGRRLHTVLDKPIGPGDDYAESWEVVDHDDGMSVVASGPLAGTTLRELTKNQSHELFGKHAPQARFPLLFKFLDAQRTLSVQVHPNDAQGALLDPPDLGKTEAWVVIAADPGSKIYAGLKPDVDAETLRKATDAGECEDCLHAFEPKVGDCVFLAAGGVHALGEGLVIAEIQQASNTTFRLFDWNRVDKNGQPRQLHIEESLTTIDFDRGPIHAQTPTAIAEGQERLVECDKFILDRWKPTAPIDLPDDERFHLLAVLEGEAQLTAGDKVLELSKGDVTLLPAHRHASVVTANGGEPILLDMYLP